ncbi:MAG: metallochaperone AztD [Acuticoccus sp.]
MCRVFTRLPSLVLAAALLSAAPVAPAFADEEASVWRLFVADQAAPTVTVLDIGNDARWQFDLTGPARLYPTPSGRAVVAVQSDDETVDFLASGIVREAHDGHADIEIGAPRRIEETMKGPRPFHVVTHGDVVAINFDRGGYARFLTETDVLNGTIGGTRFPQNRAHHGFAVPLGDRVVSSVASEAPTAEGAAPPRVGIGVFTPDGAPVVAMAACTDLHGEAFSGDFLVAGCKEGVIALDTARTPPAFRMLAYPQAFPEGHTGTLLGARAMQAFLGNYGAGKVVVIDPVAKEPFTLVDLPFRRVDFVLDPARPQYGYILTEDGTLHRLDLLAGAIEASAPVTAPYSMDGHWRDPRPRLAVAGDHIVVTDPLKGLVRLVDWQTLAETGAIEVPGLPYNVVAIGGDGLTH